MVRIRIALKLKAGAAHPPPNPPALIHLLKSEPHTSEAWYKTIKGRELEKAYGLVPGILKHLIEKESKGDPFAKSQCGAKGLFQIMPLVARGCKINPLDPFQSAKYAAETLARNLKDLGSYEKALAAYNWGRKNVLVKGLHKAPKETRDYLRYFRSLGIF